MAKSGEKIGSLKRFLKKRFETAAYIYPFLILSSGIFFGVAWIESLFSSSIYSKAIGLVAAFVLCCAVALPVGLWLGGVMTRRRFTPVKEQAQYFVRVTDDKITSSGPGKPTETVLWSDLAEVAVVNEDAWPVGVQYWLLVETGGAGAVVPSDAEGVSELLEAMQKRLPEFDNEAVIQAMGSVDQSFRVWKKPEDTAD